MIFSGVLPSNASEKLFTYGTNVSISTFVKPSSNSNAGIKVPGIPSVIDRVMSSSVGKLVVERILNLPDVKSRGLGSRYSAANPSPLPSSPWQTEQYSLYRVAPVLPGSVADSNLITDSKLKRINPNIGVKIKLCLICML